MKRIIEYIVKGFNWIKDWIMTSNRYKHLIFGIIFGAIANSWYCCEYGAVGVGGALELKDKLWGGKPEIWDFVTTIIGFNIGYLIRLLVVWLM